MKEYSFSYIATTGEEKQIIRSINLPPTSQATYRLLVSFFFAEIRNSPSDIQGNLISCTE